MGRTVTAQDQVQLSAKERCVHQLCGICVWGVCVSIYLSVCLSSASLSPWLMWLLINTLRWWLKGSDLISLSLQPQRFGCNVTFHPITLVYTKFNSLWPADTQDKEQKETDLDNLISHSFLVIGNIAENVVLIIVLMKTENPDRHLTNSGTLYITFVLTTKYPAGCNIISLFLEHPPDLSCIINVYFGCRSAYSWFFRIFTFF